MIRIIDLGAPSKTDKDTNALLIEMFAGATFPLKLVIKNHMPRDVVFPEVDGLYLRHVASAKGTEKEVLINDFDQLQRLASSVEQIAELNEQERAVTISEPAAGVLDSAKKPSDGLSLEQLKDALKAKGFDFQPNAKKAELAALLDAVKDPGGASTSTNNG